MKTTQMSGPCPHCGENVVLTSGAGLAADPLPLLPTVHPGVAQLLGNVAAGAPLDIPPLHGDEGTFDYTDKKLAAEMRELAGGGGSDANGRSLFEHLCAMPPVIGSFPEDMLNMCKQIDSDIPVAQCAARCLSTIDRYPLGVIVGGISAGAFVDFLIGCGSLRDDDVVEMRAYVEALWGELMAALTPETV